MASSLNAARLKEMQLSFKLTEEREAAAGRSKTGKIQPPVEQNKRAKLPVKGGEQVDKITTGQKTPKPSKVKTEAIQNVKLNNGKEKNAIDNAPKSVKVAEQVDKTTTGQKNPKPSKVKSKGIENVKLNNGQVKNAIDKVSKSIKASIPINKKQLPSKRKSEPPAAAPSKISKPNKEKEKTVYSKQSETVKRAEPKKKTKPIQQKKLNKLNNKSGNKVELEPISTAVDEAEIVNSVPTPLIKFTDEDFALPSSDENESIEQSEDAENDFDFEQEEEEEENESVDQLDDAENDFDSEEDEENGEIEDAGSDIDFDSEEEDGLSLYSDSDSSEYQLDTGNGDEFLINPVIFNASEEQEIVEQPPVYLPEAPEENIHQMQLESYESTTYTKIVVFEGMITEENSKEDSSEEQPANEDEEATEDVAEQLSIEENGEEEPMEEFVEDLIEEEPMEEFVEDLIEDPPLENNIQQATEDVIEDSIEDSVEPMLSVFENSLKSNNVLAVIKNDIELYGSVSLQLLSGRLLINGYKARKSETLTIYSPKGFNWVTISPLASVKAASTKLLNLAELNESFSRAQLDNILGNYDGKVDAIVLLQRNSGAQKLVNNFAKHMAENVFPQANKLPTNRPLYASEYLLHCLIQSADKSRGLIVPPQWPKLPLKKESRLMITGGKSVGKSTLLRYMINRHLSKHPQILVIDLDIGQPEIFVQQTISCSVVDEPLLGPGFFYNRQPAKAFVVGHVSIVMCAEQYLRAVQQLLQHCHKNASYANMPWLINTMGYNKGFGLELMSLLVNYIQPTDIVQIASPKQINNFDESLESSSLAKVQRIIYTAEEFKVKSKTWPKYKLHHLASAKPPPQRLSYGNQKEAWLMSAKEVRYANVLARLSAALQGNAKWLTDCQPLRVAIDEVQLLHLTNKELTKEELLAGMEANIVFLCQRQKGAAEVAIECLGLGVVRAIDYKANNLYLVPAMPLERLSRVNCLVLGGDLTLPQGYFKDQGAGVANNVPFVFIIDDSKSSKSIRQIYHRAPEFLGKAGKAKK